MTQFDVAVPTRCSAEQIAGLIYVNIATNGRQDADTCRRHFEALNVPLVPVVLREPAMIAQNPIESVASY